MKSRQQLAPESSDTQNFPALALIVVALCWLPPAWTQARTVIPVANEPELYAAVNEPAHAGALVLLSGPRTYRLDPSYRNGGRLELQPDMALQGVTGNRESVIIDADALQPSSYSTPSFTTGAIRMGRGTNSLEWLTVQNARNGAASAIATDLVSGDFATVRVAHVLAINNVRGLDVRNIGPGSAGRDLEVDIEDNWFTGHTTGAGQGLRIINADASEARISASLTGNMSYGNIIGCIAANINTTKAKIDIKSSGDRFEGNGNGCVFIAGLTQANVSTLATHNQLKVQMQGGSISGNNGPLPVAFPVPAGIIAIGGQSAGGGNRAFENSLDIKLADILLGDNQGPDIHAFGAVSDATAPAGTNNSVNIDLGGISPRPETEQTPSQPPEPAGTNTVRIAK